MTRVATIPLQRIMSGGIMHAQQLLQTSQTQLASGKKAPDFAALGTDGVRNMSAHTLAAQQTAYAGVATRVGTTLALYDAHIGAIDTAATALRDQILAAIGTGQSSGLGASFETAFDQLRGSLNADVDGVPLFGGAQTGKDPLKPATFAAMAGQDPATAFANDAVKSIARVGDGVDMQYGITASDVGTTLLAAFRTLADAGAIGATPTDAQKAALTAAVGQIDAGLGVVRSISADNGRRQAQADTMATRAAERGDLLASIISTNEDADLGQIAVDIAQNKSVLQASYSVFAQLASLNLGAYLR
jgi:flagellar hook-associated protein 3 FlgL